MSNDKLYLNVLIQAQAFETFWAYFSQSGGEVYSGLCQKTAGSLVASIELLLENESNLIVEIRESLGKDSKIDHMIDRLKQLSVRSESYPLGEIFSDKITFFVLLATLKSFAFARLRITNPPPLIWTGDEFHHAEKINRWKGHLAYSLIFPDPDEVFREASRTLSIAVVGDIRRSQDLMTYAQGADSFSERMVRFISKTRELVEKHAGFFDKFTGDGFIIYFNEAICNSVKKDYRRCFLDFAKDQFEFSKSLFKEWSTSIRKLPTSEVGLTIGADVGQLDFHDLDNHLVAVGDAIVWASRMAEIGSAHEIIVNNLLFNLLKTYDEALSFVEREGITKSGERFVAHILTT
jgi:class 3 adenylate cyclase